MSGKARHRGLDPRKRKFKDVRDGTLSRMGHEKSRLNLGGPPSKAKYYPETDSEPVP